MLKNKTIERRVKARMRSKIEDAQKKYDDEKRRLLDAFHEERMRLEQDYLDDLTALNLREDATLVKLEDDCVGEACAL